MKLNKHSIPDYIFNLILAYLLVCFILSCVISFKNEKDIIIKRTEVVNYAMQYLDNKNLIKKGKSFDCSGFTRAVYRRFNINIPGSSRKQFELGSVSNSSPAKGDLVFFKTNSRIVSHVGIYLGDEMFIHSPDKGREVRIDSLSNKYYSERYKGSVNIFPAKNTNFE